MIFWIPLAIAAGASIVGGMMQNSARSREQARAEDAAREGFEMRRQLLNEERDYDREKTRKGMRFEGRENRRDRGLQRELLGSSQAHDRNMADIGFGHASRLSAQDFNQTSRLSAQDFRQTSDLSAQNFRQTSDLSAQDFRQTGELSAQDFRQDLGRMQEQGTQERTTITHQMNTEDELRRRTGARATNDFQRFSGSFRGGSNAR